MASAVHPSDASGTADAASGENSPTLVGKSLGIIPLESPLRRWTIRFVSQGSPFDVFVLVMILLNAVLMACTDYRYVDEDYSPSSELSVRNRFIEMAEVWFVALFAAECLLKVLAYGFVVGDNTYLRNHWNKFDFIVVLFSLVSMVPLVPNLSVMRSIRVLRPLRSISKLPGLRKIIESLVNSVGDLANVLLLLVFLLTFFSITGVIFWKGLFHARCRLTPYPVRMPGDCRRVEDACWQDFLAEIAQDPSPHRCLSDANNDDTWTQSTSPWFTKGPQDCIWPIDAEDDRVCSLAGTGCNTCPPAPQSDGTILKRTCGSNYDAYGNPRFIDSTEPYGFSRMKSSEFIEALNWGFTNYDNVLSAFVTTFQVVSLEGWTDIMYQTIDAWFIGPAIFIYTILIVLGGYIVLNLVLAVITSSLDNMEQEKEENGQIPVEANEHQIEGNDAASLHQSQGKTESRPLIPSNLRELLDNPIHSQFIMGCIVLNTVVLSMDHYGISDERMTSLEVLNFVFTFIFLIDVIACNVAYGIRKYWSNPFNCFDGLIAVVSVVEIVIMSTRPFGSDGPSSFSVFRSLRLFRVFKMAKSWKSLHSLLRTMTETVQEIGNFAVLLALFIFIYALIGMQLFANRMRFHPDTGVPVDISDPDYVSAAVPRSHFDGLSWSMITVFQLLSGENWNAVMYDGWRATSWVAVVYFLSLVVCGVFIVMNLFLAILIKNFENSDSLSIDSTRLEKLIQNDKKHRRSSIKRLSIAFQKGVDFLGAIADRSIVRALCRRFVENQMFDSVITVLILLSSVCLALDNPLANPESTMSRILRILDLVFTITFIAEMLVKVLAYGFLFRRGAYLRDSWNVMDFVVVIVSVLNLANVGPGDALRVLRTFRVLRPLRMINRLPELKLVVDALLLSLPSVANVAVLCGLFFLIFSSFGVNFLKGTFYHCDGDTFSQLSTDQVAYLTEPTEWGSLSAEEQAWFDVDSPECLASNWDRVTIPTSKEVCNCLAPGEWVSVVPQNFNNVLSGMALLFEISTTEGWVDVMYAAIDQRGIDAQPIRDNNILWSIFFVVFLIVGAFFVLELFVGVTIDNFNKIRETKGRGLMTEAQREWASTQAFVMKIKPERRIQRPPDSEPIRAKCYDFIMPGTNPKFEQGIAACIILNTMCAAAVGFGDSQQKANALEALNMVFAVIFVMEAAVKIFALRAKYFADGWNRFDFGIVCGSTIGLIVGAFVPNVATITSLIRICRILRLARLVKSVKNLRALFNTMVASIPSIANIGCLLFLLFFMYAVAGCQLYSFIPHNGDVNHQANFRSFGNALLLLLRFSTGENWNGFMRSMMVGDIEGCDPEPTYDASVPWCLTTEDYPDCTKINGCPAGFSAFLYFYTFTLLVTFVIVNLFVGVVLEAFESNSEGDILSPSDLETFTKLWAEYDPDATWFISADRIRDFVSELEPPLGFGRAGNNVEDVMKDKCLMDIPVNSDGKVNIVPVATMLAKRLAIQKQGSEFNELADDHPIQKRILVHTKESDKTLREVYGFNQPQQRKLMALRAFVKGQKADAFKAARNKGESHDNKV